MTRRRAVAALVLVVGGLVVLSLSTISAGTTSAQARYAQISLGSHTLDIWRDGATHDVIFHWDGDNESKASRYIAKRFTLAKLGDGKILSEHRYPSRAAAWQGIHGLFGVTWPQVRDALIAGSPSDLPPNAGD